MGDQGAIHAPLLAAYFTLTNVSSLHLPDVRIGACRRMRSCHWLRCQEEHCRPTYRRTSSKLHLRIIYSFAFLSCHMMTMMLGTAVVNKMQVSVLPGGPRLMTLDRYLASPQAQCDTPTRVVCYWCVALWPLLISCHGCWCLLPATVHIVVQKCILIYRTRLLGAYLQ